MRLIKEIRSKEGELHFKRWRLLKTPWFEIYIHGIYKKDMDLHLHSHPWNIWTMVLSGGYVEVLWDEKNKRNVFRYRRRFNMGYRNVCQFHKIGRLLKTPTYTLAIVGNRQPELWGYLVDGKFVDHITYRERKNSK
jgi:hypothetical protein